MLQLLFLIGSTEHHLMAFIKEIISFYFSVCYLLLLLRFLIMFFSHAVPRSTKHHVTRHT